MKLILDANLYLFYRLTIIEKKNKTNLVLNIKIFRESRKIIIIGVLDIDLLDYI